MPKTNTIPDPSGGLFNCSGGLNTVESPYNLSQNHATDLKNFIPGQPAFVRNGCQDVAADNTLIGIASAITYFLPYGVAIKDGNDVVQNMVVSTDQ